MHTYMSAKCTAWACIALHTVQPTKPELKCSELQHSAQCNIAHVASLHSTSQWLSTAALRTTLMLLHTVQVLVKHGLRFMSRSMSFHMTCNTLCGPLCHPVDGAGAAVSMAMCTVTSLAMHAQSGELQLRITGTTS